MPISGTKCKKTSKMCVVCGKTFEGTDAAQSCSPSCRVKLARLKAAGKRPEYILMVKSNGQKIPDLNAPKGLKFKKGEKKNRPIIDVSEAPIEFVDPPPETYDSPKLNVANDEPLKIEKPLTFEEKIKLKEMYEAEIKDWQNRYTQGHPRQWALTRNAAIEELRGKIKALLF